MGTKMGRHVQTNYHSTIFLIFLTFLLALVFVGVGRTQTTDTPASSQILTHSSAQQRSPEEARRELRRRKIYLQENAQVAPMEFKDAAINGDLELITLLLDAGADPNQQNERGYTALHYAACNDRFEVIDTLLARGADISAKDKDGSAPLVMAVSCNKLASVEYLLKKGANINARASDGSTALVMSVAMLIDDHDSKRREIVIELLKKGANPNLTYAQGFTPLMTAACAGDPEIVKALLDYGAQVNDQDAAGETALLQTVRCDHKDNPQAKTDAPEVMKVLLAQGADLTVKAEDGQTVLKLAKERRDNQLIDLAIRPAYQASLWTKIKYWCYRFNRWQGWGAPIIYLLSVMISGIALKIQKPLPRKPVEEGDGLKRLAPLQCQQCAAPVPVSITKNECPSCGAAAEVPEDYRETLKLRQQAAEQLQKAERIWKRASFYTQEWLFFSLFGVAVIWLAVSLIGFFGDYVMVKPVTLFVSTLLGTITFPLAFYSTSDYLATASNLLPKLPQVGRRIAEAEETSCKTCAAPARFEAHHLVASCGYCGSELYREALARRARKAAAEDEEGTAISIYDGAVALQERQRKLFQSIEVIGSFLLLVIAVTAFSLIVLAIIAVILALYLYLVLS